MLATKDCFGLYYLAIVEVSKTYCKACTFYEGSHKSLSTESKRQAKVTTAMAERVKTLEEEIAKMKKTYEEKRDIAPVKQLAMATEGMEKLQFEVKSGTESAAGMITSKTWL